MSVCSVCDTSLPQHSRFCPSCGTPVPGPGGTAKVSDPASEQLERLRRVLAGRFEVLQELGRGGMASVYLARQVSLDRELAIKVLNPALNQDADLVQRFLREARTQGRLEHPGIIPVYEVYQEGGFSFYTMPRIQGPSLRLFLKENPKPPIETARRLLREAADALGYAHKQGLIHRDVKPENMLMDAQRHRLILTDFGIAKTLSSVTMLTMTGEQLGTPRYMAPDQGDTKRPLDGRSDQYSLGLVAYEMLAGHMAFQADNLAELMYKHRYEEPEPLATLRPDAPAGLVAAVMRAISKNRDERFDTMEDFAAGLLMDEAPAPARSVADTVAVVVASPAAAVPPAPAAPPAAAVPPAAAAPPAAALDVASPASPLTATSSPTPMSSGGVWRHDPVKGWTLEPALAEPLPAIPPGSPGGRKKGGRPVLPPLFGGRGRRRSLWKWIGLGVAIVTVLNGLGGRKSRRTTRESTVVVDESALPADVAPGAVGDVPVPVPPEPAAGGPDGAPPVPSDSSPQDWDRAVQAFAGLQAGIDSAFGGSVPAEVGRLAGLRARAESLAASGNFRGGAQLIREAGNDLRRLSRRALQQKVAVGVAAGNAARARASAMSAGLDKSQEEAFAAADELRDAAVDAQEGGQLVEAEKKFRAAARAYAGLARGADATPGGAGEPGAAAAPAAPPATADPSVEIGAQLDRFGAAFATEDVAKIQGEFPGLTLGRGEIGLFRMIFERTDNLGVARRVTRISGEGDTRTADVDYVLSFKQARTQEAGQQTMKLRCAFAADGQGGWHLKSLARR